MTVIKFLKIKVAMKGIAWILLLIGCVLPEIECSAQSQLELGNFLYKDNGEQWHPELSRKNAIVIFNIPPQCHDCEEKIYHFMNELKFRNTELVIVFGPMGTALLRQSLQQTAMSILQVQYLPLYFDRVYDWQTTMSSCKNSPFILLLSANNAKADYICYGQIFSNELWDSSICRRTRQKIRRFAKSGKIIK